MHVDYLIVDSTPNARLVVIRQNVCVYQGTQEILVLHVLYVSRQSSFYFLFSHFFYCMLNWMILYILAERPIEPVLSVGCEQDDDCPLYTACRNRQCINPCAEDSPCAPSAICRVINHEPLCTCPDGFIGSPHTDCRPRKFQFKYHF